MDEPTFHHHHASTGGDGVGVALTATNLVGKSISHEWIQSQVEEGRGDHMQFCKTKVNKR